MDDGPLIFYGLSFAVRRQELMLSILHSIIRA